MLLYRHRCWLIILVYFFLPLMELQSEVPLHMVESQIIPPAYRPSVKAFEFKNVVWAILHTFAKGLLTHQSNWMNICTLAFEQWVVCDCLFLFVISQDLRISWILYVYPTARSVPKCNSEIFTDHFTFASQTIGSFMIMLNKINVSLTLTKSWWGFLV